MKDSFLLIGLLAAVLGLVFILQAPQPVTVCTLEAKICPDGSAVGRNPELGCEFDACPVPAGAVFCPPESREAAACITLYDPVCGWFKPEIQCIRYPCGQTFSNSCFACMDGKVLYYTEGECPG